MSPSIASGGSNRSADVKHLWISRVEDFIDSQGGIDRWPADGEPVRVATLSGGAYMTIHPIVDQHGADTGRRVEFLMKPPGTDDFEHMATLIYGPPRQMFLVPLRRRLVSRQDHV